MSNARQKALMLALGAGAAATAVPDDAEAITPRQFVKQAINAKGGFAATSPTLRKTIKNSAKFIPHGWMDDVEKITEIGTLGDYLLGSYIPKHGFEATKGFAFKNAAKKAVPMAAGLAIAGAAMPTDEAEAAARFGKLTRQTFDTAAELAVKTKPYHDTKHLLGTQLELSFNDMPKAKYMIMDVRKSQGKPQDYFVILQNSNGERFQLPMSKSYFKSLNQAEGTAQYLDEFADKPPIAKQAQAEKSLQIRTNNLGRVTENEGKANLQRIGKISPELKRDYVYFQAVDSETPVYMPKLYAWFLEKMHKGKIVQETSGKAKVQP